MVATVHDVPAAAHSQGGAFTREQAMAHGWTARQVRRRLEGGRWVRIAGPALASAGCGRSPARDAWGVALAWPEAIATFRTAAGLWGLPVRQDDRVHVQAHPGRRARGVTVHLARLAATDVDVHPEGLAVTSMLRTTSDCLARCDLDEALDLYAWLVSRRLLTRSQFAALVRQRAGTAGADQLHRLQRLTITGAVSAAEFRAHAVLRAAGLTGWVANAEVSDADGVIGVVDLLFRRERLVVEIDGRRAHVGRAVFVADRRRQNRLVNAGYRVLRFTWWDVVDRPDAVVASIRLALKISDL